jgi:hypothetical protein
LKKLILCNNSSKIKNVYNRFPNSIQPFSFLNGFFKSWDFSKSVKIFFRQKWTDCDESRGDRTIWPFWAHQVDNNSDGQFTQIGNTHP